MHENSFLQHYGVLGMRWGRRKSRPLSEDYKRSVELQLRRLKTLNESEIKELTTRLRLESDFYKARSGFSRPKDLRKLSNEELKKEIARRVLLKEDFKYGIRKDKRISKMTDAEVAEKLKRHYLEKKIRELQKEQITLGFNIAGEFFKIMKMVGDR